MYEIEFPDGEIRPYAANVIADNIWAQVDPEGQRYVIFESIIDYHVDSSVTVSKTCISPLMVGRLCKERQQV